MANTCFLYYKILFLCSNKSCSNSCHNYDNEVFKMGMVLKGNPHAKYTRNSAMEERNAISAITLQKPLKIMNHRHHRCKELSKWYTREGHTATNAFAAAVQSKFRRKHDDGFKLLGPNARRNLLTYMLRIIVSTVLRTAANSFQSIRCLHDAVNAVREFSLTATEYVLRLIWIIATLGRPRRSGGWKEVRPFFVILYTVHTLYCNCYI